jgi:hypothetical protein
LSQGGYALLEKNMMADRLKERQQAAGGSEVPPPRHEKWMKARTKPSGEYTSEDTRLVAEKIVSSYTIVFLALLICGSCCRKNCNDFVLGVLQND